MIKQWFWPLFLVQNSGIWLLLIPKQVFFVPKTAVLTPIWLFDSLDGHFDPAYRDVILAKWLNFGKMSGKLLKIQFFFLRSGQLFGPGRIKWLVVGGVERTLPYIGTSLSFGPDQPNPGIDWFVTFWWNSRKLTDFTQLVWIPVYLQGDVIPYLPPPAILWSLAKQTVAGPHSVLKIMDTLNFCTFWHPAS